MREAREKRINQPSDLPLPTKARPTEKSVLRRPPKVRPLSSAMKAAQARMTEGPQRVKDLAAQLRNRIDNPVFDSPMNPAAGFPDEVSIMAKRGRRIALVSAFLGSNVAKRAIRGHGRSARKYGHSAEEMSRLQEYPDAKKRYRAIILRLHDQTKTNQHNACGTSGRGAKRDRPKRTIGGG